MPSPLADAHIEGQRRLRERLALMVAKIWRDLPAHDQENVDQWLSQVLPIVLSAQRSSVAITNAYLARAMERQPLGLDVAALTGAAVRNGTPPADVYQRPFVTLWAALGAGVDYADALARGLDRATSTAATDVQLSMRATATAVDAADPYMYGFQRVADPGACEFCQQFDGAYIKGNGFVFALHNNCGCSLEPLTEPHPKAVRLPDGTKIRPHQYGPLNDTVAVHLHGELGPVITPAHIHFTSESDI